MFRLKGHTIIFFSQTQTLEPPYRSLSFSVAVKKKCVKMHELHPGRGGTLLTVVFPIILKTL